LSAAIFIYVTGILNLPGLAENWVGRAVTWTHIHTPHKAEKIEYFTGPFTRPAYETERADKLIKTLGYYAGWQVTIVAHSNGCDVVSDALKRLPGYPLAGLYLIAGACSRDFEKNGFNVVPVPRVNIWISTRDETMWMAGTFFGKWLGYGTLGKAGPVNAKVPVKVLRKEWGHSDWFAPAHFDETMQRITNIE
jgi:pimeloyl-ACP methyl ester carboxylesterase